MKRCKILGLLLLIACGGFAQAPPATEQAPGTPAETYFAEGESARGRILVPVRFGPVGPYPFLLDLSLRHPVIDAQLAARIGLPRAEVGPDAGDAPFYLLKAMRCGTLPPREALLAGVDLSGIGARIGRPVAGLWPAHQPGLEAEIDIANARVVWRDFSASTLLEDSAALPMTLGEDGAPRVTVRLLDRVEHSVGLDLSVGERLVLSDALLRKLGVLKGDTPRLVIPGASGPVTQCRLPRLHAGDAEFASVLCTVASESGKDRMGLGLLRHFTLTLNYEFGLAKLAPHQGGVLRDPPLTGYGLVLDAFRNGLWTVRVVEASPAHRAGIRSGDQLVSLAGERVAGVRYELVRSLLEAEAGALLRVTYRRGSQPPQTATLTAEVLL